MMMPYLAAGLIAVVLVFLVRSHLLMNRISVIHAALAFALAVLSLTKLSLPAYYLPNGFLFIDHFGIYEVLISTMLFFFAGIYASGYVQSLLKTGELHARNLKIFYGAFNLLLTVTIFAFFSNNLALFWIFAELTTLLSAVLIVTLNAKENIHAALKYVFIASSAMLFSFVGLILLFTLTQQTLTSGTLNWNVLMANATVLSPTMAITSFAFIFIGFAAKSGVAPFHTWVPHAYSKAPSAIGAILAGVVSNIGIYGLLRVHAIVRQTDASSVLSILLLSFGMLSIALAVLSMLEQKNLKHLIAFSSVKNAGFLLVGMGIGTPVALFWVLFHILGHSVSKALLFFSAGILHRQYQSNEDSHIVNAFNLQPLASWGLILGSVSIVGMPPFALFLSKFFIISQLANPWLLALLLVLLLIAAAAFIVFLTRIFSRSEVQEDRKVGRYAVSSGMKVSIILLIAGIVVLGLFIPESLRNLLAAIVASIGGN